MYATAEDMRARYREAPLVQLTDAVAWDAAAIAAIETKLAAASARADAYVAKYYAPAPGRAVPPLLTEIVCEIAFADLHRDPTDEVLRRKRDAIADLLNISKGLIKIDEGQGDLPGRAGAVIVPDAPRTFSRDTMSGF